MKRWRTKLLFLAGAALSTLAIPAASQEAPESLLPPGFDSPPPPAQSKQDQSQPAAPRPSATTSDVPTQLLPPEAAAGDGDVAQVTVNGAQQALDALPEVALPKPIEMPESARRSTAMVGALGTDNWGFAPDAFGRSDGRFLSTLMRRLNAPLPSRWESMLLRRALLSRVSTPRNVSDVDWTAERAWLLLRMGEADAARMLVQAVDVDQFTPKMLQVAVQTALATSDPAGLCPLVDVGRSSSNEPVWPLADAMCAALQGDASKASGMIDQARRRGSVPPADLLFAEKVVGAGPNTRRAVTIQWDQVDWLNSWRFGLASATGVSIPTDLLDRSSPRIRAWQARATMVPLDDRLSSIDTAASLGVFSNASLVETYSLVADTTDPADMNGSVGGRLRTAYVARSEDDRVSAMKSLWDDGKTPALRHARLILTAAAAARIPPNEAYANDSGDLIASMLTAGLDAYAARWSAVVDGMDAKTSDRAWALLALGTPQPRVAISPGRVSGFASRDDSSGRTRSRLLLAALVGLDRLPANARSGLEEDLGVSLDHRDRWTIMIDAAADKRQAGTVALLAAVGMQSATWDGVPPAYLYHAVRALRQVGLDYEARMIAAEAVSRA